MEDSARRLRTRRSAAEWRAIMVRYEASGLSGEGFCEAEGIGKSAFWRWRRRLAEGDAGSGGKALFVELAAGPSSPWDVELELGAGTVAGRSSRCCRSTAAATGCARSAWRPTGSRRRPGAAASGRWTGRRCWRCWKGVDMEVKGRRRRYRRAASGPPSGVVWTSTGTPRKAIAERRRDRGAAPGERASRRPPGRGGPGPRGAAEDGLSALRETAAALKAQLEWFKRQLFGRRSEKRLEIDLTEQASLFEALGAGDVPPPEVATETISYRRRRKACGDAVNESGLRFDDTVPVTTIEVRDPAVESIPEPEWSARR